MEVVINKATLRLVEGDIIEQETDAIVNAANQYLQLGSGVAGAIRRKGGPTIQQECDAIGRCPVGDGVLTGGGNLKAGYVIHAVGLQGGNPEADRLLISATRRSLEVAAENGLTSITFPAISTGIFGYPIEKAAANILRTTIDYLMTAEGSLALVVFCLYGQNAFDVFTAELQRQTG